MSHALESARPSHADLGLQLAAALVWILTLAQGLLFALAAGGLAATVAGALALASTLALWLAPGHRSRLALLLLLGAAAAGQLALEVARNEVGASWPALRSGVLYGHGALWLACVVSLLWRRVHPGVFVVAALLGVGLPVVERSLLQVKDGTLQKPVVRWVGGTVRHPTLEEVYRPDSTATTFYTANPRGYFEPVDQRAQRWQLNLNDSGSSARLVLPEDPARDRIRVEIDRVAGNTPWHLQLSYGRARVRKGEGLLLAFRVRADAPRALSVSLGQAHPPWQPLGLYRRIEAGPAWRDVVISVNASAGDDQARVAFDLGGETAAVEIEGLVLRRRSSSQSVIDPLPDEYVVQYRFNDRGCRGPSLPAPAPAGHRRVLLLGDSFTVGVGVHEQDTLAVQLQGLLNARSPGTRWDVVNCGVSGYATRQERLMYELQAPHYRPDIVILAMVENDDVSWVQDVANGHFFVPGQLDVTLPMAGAVRRTLQLRDKPPPDFSANVRELRQLAERVRQDGAQLAVVLFRNVPLSFGQWQAIADVVPAGLQGTGAVWLDLGDEMLRRHDHAALHVFPGGGDAHPNEISHRSAAEQIDRLLQRQQWVP